MAIRILATGDIHIGCRPSRVADPADAERFSCAAMWQAIVERAIAERVDLVALSGDLVDHNNRFYEATGPFERGLLKLAQHGIETYAVAGNHDFDVLPRLVETVGPQNFHLLGRGGRWEDCHVMRDGRPVLSIHGWSFPQQYAPTSPLIDYALASDPRIPTLALLHADLDNLVSRYAPVARAELNARPVTMWLLGHIHAPCYLPAAAGPALLYPGSPQAMDPGETGVHGPWIVEIEGPHAVRARQLPMSQVRYDVLPLDLTDSRTLDDFDRCVHQTIGTQLTSAASTDPPPALLSLRLRLIGRTPLCGSLSEPIARLVEDFERSAGPVTARIDKVYNETRGDFDLARLAEKQDLVGVVARTLLALQSTPDNVAGNGNVAVNGDAFTNGDARADRNIERLVLQAREKILDAHRAPPYALLAGAQTDREEAPPIDELARGLLIRQGTLLLEALRAQECAP